LHDHGVEAQQYRASGLAVVTAAIALWNTAYLGSALDDLRLYLLRLRVKSPDEEFHIKPDGRAPLSAGHLDPSRSRELTEQTLVAGLPV
jgi:hypothetical protein